MALHSLLFALCVTARPAAGTLGPDDRPTLSGPELTHLSADGLFKVHYTLQGGDALAVTDDGDPRNGVPDSVDWVEEGAARVYHTFVDADGWPVPPNDEGVGGDNRIDIYVRALDNNGYTHFVTLPSGNKASYIEIAPGNARLSKGTFESISGHELHHVLQFGMTDRAASWIYEATATYAQYLVFDEDPLLQLAREALWRVRLGQPELALAATGNRYEYAGMVWAKYLVDKGTPDRRKLLFLWQAMAFYKDWVKGHDAFVAANLGLENLDAAAADFAAWNWFACGNADGRHYDPGTLPCLGGTVTSTDVTTLPADGTTVAIGPRGSAYLHVVRDCKTGELDLTVRPTGAMRIQVIRDLPQVASAIETKDAPAGVDTALAVAGWNDAHQIAVVATNLSAAAATVTYHATARGSYSPGALPRPASLEVAPEFLQLAIGERHAFTLKGTFGTCADGSDVSAKVKWTASDPTIVRVEGSEIVALRRGTTELFATLDGVGSNHLVVMVRGGIDSTSCQMGNSGAGGPSTVIWVLIAWGIQMWDSRRRHPT